MIKNEGMVDRIIRAILAIIFFYLGYARFQGVATFVFYILGLIALVTAISGVCALYKIVGIKTLKK